MVRAISFFLPFCRRNWREPGDKQGQHSSIRRDKLESLLLKHSRRATSDHSAAHLQFSLSPSQMTPCWCLLSEYPNRMMTSRKFRYISFKRNASWEDIHPSSDHASHVSVMCATGIRLYSLCIPRGGGGYFFCTSIFFAHPPGPKRKEYMLTSIYHVFLRSS